MTRTKRKKTAARKRKRREVGGDRDYLLEAANENYEHIVTMYKMFEDKRPIMLFDIQEQKVYAYSYKEFRDEMNERSQALLEQQYERAKIDNKMIVFVRDNVNERLVSFSFDCP
jgi:hypothetical protein